VDVPHEEVDPAPEAHAPAHARRLVEATPSLREPRYAREVRDFFKAHPLPEAARALRQALEVFRLNAELRKRVTPGSNAGSRARKEPAPAAKARRAG
jgi:hypothetical protein